MSDVRYWLGFNLVPHVGPVRVRALLAHFGNLEAAWRADAANLRAAGLPQNAIQELQYRRQRLDLNAELRKVEDHGLQILTWESDGYPSLLRNIDQPPPVLYVNGEITSDDDWAVAVVGTRNATSYGLRVAERFAGALAENNVTVVSGLALGVDGAAHRAALRAGGRTIAVLGCGL
ncbi:MAG: DNA-processing protein DprA, partial [Chloroflexi bacterium]|nr:DNA-processing protein DprA [Chloroflexota bacterium]